MIISNLNRIKVVAHRGGKFDEENTLANFKKALNYAQIHPDVDFHARTVKFDFSDRFC